MSLRRWANRALRHRGESNLMQEIVKSYGEPLARRERSPSAIAQDFRIPVGAR
jgi:hypothetical protein